MKNYMQLSLAPGSLLLGGLPRLSLGPFYLPTLVFTFYEYPSVQSLAVVVHILKMVIPHVFWFLSALLSLPLSFRKT
jgi:hypothetical protein